MGAEAPAFAGPTIVLDQTPSHEANIYMPEIDVEIPLLDIIPPPSRRMELDSGFRYILRHEFAHFLVAEALGETVEAISFIPEGDSIARTMMKGHSRSKNAAIIAGAGGIHGSYGTAGDRDQVRAFSGQSFDTAVADAKATLYNNYEPEVLKKIYEIGACLGKGSVLHRSDLLKIVAQARLEIQLERQFKQFPGFRLDMLWDQSKWISESKQRERTQRETPEVFKVPEQGDWTVIEKTNTGISVRYFSDGKEVDAPCPVCGRIDKHIHNVGKDGSEGNIIPQLMNLSAPIVESPQLQVIFQDPPLE